MWSPATTQVWLQMRGLDALAQELSKRSAGQALAAWLQSQGELQEELRAASAALARYVEDQGVASGMIAELLQARFTVALFERDGKSRFTGYFELGDAGPAIATSLQHLAVQDPLQPKTWKLPLPLGLPGALYLQEREGRMLFADSPHSLQLLRQLTQDQGESLAKDPVFSALELRHEPAPGGAWIQAFARPASTAARFFSESSLESHPLWRLGISEIPGIAWTGLVTENGLQDEWKLSRPTGPQPSPLALADRTLNPELAHLVPARCEHYVLMSFETEAWLSKLEQSKLPLLGGLSLDELELLLLSKKQISDRQELISLLGTDLVLVRTADGGSSPMISLALGDSFRAQRICDELGQRVTTKGDTDTADGFALYEFTGRKSPWYATVQQDRLFVSNDQEALAQWLRNVQQGLVRGRELAVRIEESKASILGCESPRGMLLRADVQGQLGLRSLADSADLWHFTAQLTQRTLTLSAESATGAAPVLAVGLTHVLPQLLEHRAHENELHAQKLAREISKAQQTWKALAESRGEADSRPARIDQLVIARLLSAQKSELGEESVLERNGYKHRIMLDDVHPQDWLLVSWPSQPGISGRACFALRNGQPIRRNEWIAQLDEGYGPLPDQVFAADPFNSDYTAGWTELSAPIVAIADKEDAPKAAPETEVPVELPLAKLLELVDAYAQKKELTALRKMLDHEDAAVQARVAHRLGELGDRDSVPGLARLARESTDAEARRRATWSLSRMRDPRSDATLLGLLSDEDAKVRVFAVQGLSTSKAPGVNAALLELIQAFPSDEAGERSLAALLLGDRRAVELLPKLANVSAGKERFADSLTCCFQQLSPSLEPQAEAELLVTALESPVERLRLYAVERLAAQEYAQAVPALMAQLDKENGALAARIEEALAALEPAGGIDFDALLSSAQAKASSLWATFRKQPKPMQLGIALAPLLLLMGLTLMRLKRRARRRQSSEDVRDYLEPSEETLSEPSLLDESAAGGLDVEAVDGLNLEAGEDFASDFAESFAPSEDEDSSRYGG
jgi:HEAT repeat protein